MRSKYIGIKIIAVVYIVNFNLLLRAGKIAVVPIKVSRWKIAARECFEDQRWYLRPFLYRTVGSANNVQQSSDKTNMGMKKLWMPLELFLVKSIAHVSVVVIVVGGQGLYFHIGSDLYHEFDQGMSKGQGGFCHTKRRSVLIVCTRKMRKPMDPLRKRSTGLTGHTGITKQKNQSPILLGYVFANAVKIIANSLDG